MHNNISVAAPSSFPFDFKVGAPTSTVWNVLGFSTRQAAVSFLAAATTAQKTTVGSKAWILANSEGIGTPPTSLSTKTYQALYTVIASAYYGTTINPVSTLTTGDLNSILNIRDLLAGQINALSAQTSALAKGNGSLLYALKTVYADLPSDQTSFTSWVLDNYTNPTHAASAGKIENDLTTAMTAAQSLNDSQKEKVRQFLFIFQEYYQSASAILSKITQIISKMAQKISQ